MKLFRSHFFKNSRAGGFSLVEASFTLGLLSFGFLTLVPLLAVGLQSAHAARDERASALIARNLLEQKTQGTLAPGTLYLTQDGLACSPLTAVFIVQPSTASAGAAATRFSLRITPVGAPNQARVYAALLPGALQD